MYRVLLAMLTGKRSDTVRSFGLVLALLNQERKKRPPTQRVNYGSCPITSVVITPHRDLAYQFMHWIGSILDVTPDAVPLASVAQVLLRNVNVPIDEQIRDLKATSPQILIATPQALLDAMTQDVDPLDLRGISTVVVDEADYLLESIPVKIDSHKKLKLEKNLIRHPSPARQILNIIYGSKRKLSSYKLKQLANRDKSETDIPPFRPRPQLVLSSATLRATFRGSLLNEGWLTAHYGELIKVGDAKNKKSMANDTLGGSSIVHCALVVSEDGEVSNIPKAITPENAPTVASASERAEDGVTLADEVPLAIDPAVDPAIEAVSEEEMNSKYLLLESCGLY